MSMKNYPWLCNCICNFWRYKKMNVLILAIHFRKTYHSNVSYNSLSIIVLAIFFSIGVFFHGHWRLAGQQGKGSDYFLFCSTTSNCSRTFRHLFVTLQVRWLSVTLVAPSCSGYHYCRYKIVRISDNGPG